MTLYPPVEPMLAQAAEALPGPGVLAGGAAYEQKFDGHRAILFTPAMPGGRVVVQTRRGSLVQDRFPDLVAAAERQLPGGLVLDGELLVWDAEAGRLSFEGLQRRAAARGCTAPGLAAGWPAYFVAFDVLQLDGVELLARPYRERRTLLEDLFTDHALAAPWTLCPMTTDPATAREWLESWTDVSGVEGVVAKGMNQPYRPSVRGWTKVRRRDTTEAIIGAITGTLARPQLLVLGRHDPAGRLRAVGRTVPLHPEQARQVGEHLAAPGPGHPWEGVRFASTWGSRDVLDVTLVRPDLVAEVSADRAVDRGGVFRHPLRFQRLRVDVTARDVPGFGAGAVAAAG
ncbi:ATP-dependent DNA ligase [Streptomyces sp. DSM 41634]|uniref:ATP-dependent DNA ligase n=1 Tax=Streptomyces sp. DSM 41634 TaxID=3448656 RepID=UPI0040402D8A